MNNDQAEPIQIRVELHRDDKLGTILTIKHMTLKKSYAMAFVQTENWTEEDDFISSKMLANFLLTASSAMAATENILKTIDGFKKH